MKTVFRFSKFVSAGLLLTLSACFGHDWQSTVVNQASFDHNCPVERVHVLRENGDRIARAIWVDVCGRDRLYRDIGGTQAYVYQDMTDAQSGQ